MKYPSCQNSIHSLQKKTHQKNSLTLSNTIKSENILAKFFLKKILYLFKIIANPFDLVTQLKVAHKWFAPELK